MDTNPRKPDLKNHQTDSSMPQKRSGKLILFGNLLGPLPIEEGKNHFSKAVQLEVALLDGILAESEREARRFLSYFRENLKTEPHKMPLALFHKKTPKGDLDFLFEPIRKGETWGYVSDGGLPGIADPGHLLIGYAQKRRIAHEVHMGPSSILWALILSGFPGNRFAFHGYLAKEPQKREEEIKAHIKESLRLNSVQIFIEAPYRNEALLESLIKTLPKGAALALVHSLMLPQQAAEVMSVSMWKKKLSSGQIEPLRDKPAVFLFKA